MPTMTGTTVRRASKGTSSAKHPLLRIVASPDTSQLGVAFPLSGPTYLFGRSRETQNQVRDRRMSRQHARLTPSSKGHGYLIEDLDTTNGTFLDGRRIVGRQPLDGDVLSTGDTIFVVDRPPDREGMPASPDADASSIKEIVGSSMATEALRASVATVARRSGTVLILGPTGVGKEVTARAVHRASGRSGPFVAVNCAAIPETLAESQFFGYYRGAFSGADRDQKGYFSEASGGTLFLDEVGELPLTLQAKLLRVLEDQRVQPLGHGPAVGVDLRVVAATNAQLESDGFRDDLLARLSVWTLRIPALSERKADILDLWTFFLESESDGTPVRAAAAEFSEALLLHDWPMNARELRNLARKTDGIAGDAHEFQLQDLPSALQGPLLPRFEDSRRTEPAGTTDPDVDFGQTGPIEGTPSRAQIERELARGRGNVKLVAEQNKWHRTQLYRWIKHHKIDLQRFR